MWEGHVRGGASRFRLFSWIPLNWFGWLHCVVRWLTVTRTQHRVSELRRSTDRSAGLWEIVMDIIDCFLTFFKMYILRYNKGSAESYPYRLIPLRFLNDVTTFLWMKSLWMNDWTKWLLVWSFVRRGRELWRQTSLWCPPGFIFTWLHFTPSVLLFSRSPRRFLCCLWIWSL